MADTEQPSEAPEDALQVIEEQQKKKAERLQDEMEEYKEMRKEEKEKESHEIEELKRKRAERIAQRAEEEKRLAVQRREEEARRKAEEEERKKKKAEEEEKRRQEKERRRREAEKRKGPKKPNFTIIKREGGEEIIVEEDENENKPPQKSKEMLEKEKQAALAQRITPLADMESVSTEQLEEAARDLHNQIRNLVSHEYDLEEKYKRMQYDVVELQERTRAMSKTKKKGVSSVQYDDSYDRMSDRFQNAPPKILLCSKYERLKDNRSFNERHQLYEKLSAESSIDYSRVHPIATPNGYLEED